jgi:hypothetical protein
MYLIVIVCLPLLLLFLTRVVGFAFRWQERGREIPAEHPRIQKCLRLSGIVILVGGLLAAAFVYATTKPSPGDDDDIVSYDLVGGQVFPVKASESRSYHEKLEATGGNYDVMTDEVLRWIARRWHGRNLAVTLAVLSGGGFVACFYFARWF